MEFKPENYIQAGGFNTATEILQQPNVWEKIPQILKKQENATAGIISEIKNKNGKIIFIGAGSSAFIAEIVSLALNTEGYNTSFLHTTDIVSAPGTFLKDEPTLLVSFARSGNSPESKGAIDYAKEIVSDLLELRFICDGTSVLAKLPFKGKGENIILPPETCDKGFAMTSSVTCMALAAVCAFTNNQKDFGLGLTAAVEFLKADFSQLANIAFKAANCGFTRAAILGSGVHKGSAREGYIKLCELCSGKVPVIYDSTIAFRHGPKSIVDNSTLSVHIISQNAFTAKYDLDFLSEMAAEKVGNKICVISNKEPNIPFDYCYCANLDLETENKDFFFSIISIVFMQCLAFFSSLNNGVTPDSPCKSGIVNRVVKGVKIYDFDLGAGKCGK